MFEAFAWPVLSVLGWSNLFGQHDLASARTSQHPSLQNFTELL